MSKYSIKTVILFYMSIGAFVLILALGIFLVVNHANSLEKDLINKMTIMSEDIVAKNIYMESQQSLKEFFIKKSHNQKYSFKRYIENIEFRYVDSINNEELAPLSVVKKLPNSSYLIISSSSKYIDMAVKKLFVNLIVVLTLIFGIIMFGLHLLLKKLLFPLKCLVDYCHNSPDTISSALKCEGSYEVDSLRKAIIELQGTNKKLCQEKQEIFKEAAHEIKTPIAILKARLALFRKSDMPKEEFVKESNGDITTIGNKLRELIFLKAIEWDIRQAKESVQIQNQCSIMQQLFRPILEKKALKMITNLEEDFSVFIHKESMGRVMQAVFENIFMHTKNGTTIEIYVDAKKQQISIVNEIGETSDDVLFSSQIGTKLIERLAEELEYEYSAYEKESFFYTTISFKGKSPEICKA